MFGKTTGQFVSQKLFIETIHPGRWIPYVLNYEREANSFKNTGLTYIRKSLEINYSQIYKCLRKSHSHGFIYLFYELQLKKTKKNAIVNLRCCR